MDKRERILELVKEGVLSVEEGLDLLESLSKQEDQEETVEPETTEPEKKEESKEDKEDKEEQRKSQEQTAREKVRADELEAIANEINQYSVNIDSLNDEMLAVNTERIEAEEELANRLANRNEEYLQRKKELEDRIIQLNKEMSQLSETEPEARTALQEELNQRLEELYLLEETIVSDEEIKDLEEKIKKLSQKGEELAQDKNEKMKAMHSLKMKQWTTKAKQFSDTIDIPKDWREGATKTIDKAGMIIDESSQTISQVLSEAAQKVKEGFQNLDWDDMKIDLSMKEKAAFSHEWVFEETTASILDIKNTTGNIQFKKSMNNTIKVEADIKLYELAEGKEALAAFEEAATINLNADQFTFHLPNRKASADLVIYLPERNYDYLAVKSVKGDIRFENLLARDVYIKLSAGNLSFKQLEASMLEVKLSNGNILLEDAKLKDLLASTVNGNIRVIGEVESSDFKTVHGDIVLTLFGEKMIRLVAHSVKGDLKLALPAKMSFEMEAKTVLGQVKSRLTASEKSLADKESNKMYRFFRIAEGKLCQVKLGTTRGNILLKDNDKIKGNGESDEEIN